MSKQLIRLALVSSSLAWALVPAGCGGSGGGGGSGVLSVTTFQPASVVIGQPDFVSNMDNQGGGPSEVTLDCGEGISAGSVWVADGDNSRVLRFPTGSATADLVIGQADFSTVIAGVTDARTECPTGVHQAEGKLVVADNNNNRVLIWNPVPTTNGQSANVVLGQLDFMSNSTGTSATTMRAPKDVRIVGGRLIVSDQLNHRVLVWNTVPSANTTPADIVLGQMDFLSNTTGDAANEMNRPSGIWSDGTRLLVCDRNNHRVLIWNTFPTTDQQPADRVIGQPGFGSSTFGTSDALFQSPGSVTSDGTRVVIADEGNDRVLIYNSFPTTDGQAADVVLGQSDFVHGTGNDDDQDGLPDGPTARTLDCPSGVLIDGGDLYVVDGENNRLLIYRSP